MSNLAELYWTVVDQNPQLAGESDDEWAHRLVLIEVKRAIRRKRGVVAENEARAALGVYKLLREVKGRPVTAWEQLTVRRADLEAFCAAEGIKATDVQAMMEGKRLELRGRVSGRLRRRDGGDIRLRREAGELPKPDPNTEQPTKPFKLDANQEVGGKYPALPEVTWSPAK